ncbi:MAG: hypothetical protein AAFY20_18480 [Cyanobacteria bacterium J06639_14]
MITKRELIKLIESLPDDAPVVTPGFDENHYDYVSAPELIDLKLDVLPGGLSGGKHCEPDAPLGCGESASSINVPVTSCILINF